MNKQTAFMRGEDFRALISKLKPFVSTNLNHETATLSMIELRFNSGRVTGYACNNYELVKSTADCDLESSFTAYIRVPRLLPAKNDTVIIEADFQGEKLAKTAVSFGEVTFRYKAPKSGDGIQPFEEKLRASCAKDRSDVYLNAVLFKNAIMSIRPNKRRPTILKVSVGAPNAPVFLAYEDTEAYVLPVRHKEEMEADRT